MKKAQVKIAYIGGGSRGWARTFMGDLALQGEFEGLIKLYDIDRNAAEANVRIGNMISAHKNALSHWEYEACSTLKEALVGSDFVVLSILPGTFDEMHVDVHAPERFGIYQSVGDTAGPGGIMRAMRTVPIYEKFADAIKAYCPQAYVINFTNPMTLCTKTLYDRFPKIKAFGCCHEVFGTQHLMQKVLLEEEGIKDVARKDIDIDVFGVNHFTWITRCSYQGTDIFPLYRQYIKRHKRDSCLDRIKENPMRSADIVKMDLFLKFGQIAAAGDRHLVEFLNGSWYLENPATVDRWSFGLTSVDWRREDYKKRLEKTQSYLTGDAEVPLEKSGEEFGLLMKALLGLGDIVSNVNILNNNKFCFASDNAVIETNAVFSRDGISQKDGAPLNQEVKSLVMATSLRQENIYTAIKERSISKLYNCFISEPLLGKINLSESKTLFREMIDGIKKYLDSWDLNFNEEN